MNRREWLTSLAAFGVAGFPEMVLSQTAKLIAVRTWVAPESVRMTLEYKGVVLVDSFMTEEGAPRLVVDIQGIVWNGEAQSQLNQTFGMNPLVERVRAAVTSVNGAVRCVLDLKKKVSADVSTVSATGQYQSSNGWIGNSDVRRCPKSLLLQARLKLQKIMYPLNRVENISKLLRLTRDMEARIQEQ